MNHKRISQLAVMLIGLVAFSGALQAQVAAPRLNDVSTNTLGTFNAAVLPWYQTTIVGVDVINKLKVEADFGGTTIDAGSGKGTAIFLRSVGQTFAFSAESSTLKIDINPTFSPPTGESVEIKDTVLALASKLGSSFTVSLAMEGSDFSSTNPGGTNTEKRSMPVVGGTWKISNAFYLGGTYGKSKAEFANGTNSATGDRTISRIGAGFYTRTDTSGFHVEVYKEDAGLLEVRDATNLLVYAEQGSTTGLTLEFIGGNFLFGLESVKTSTDELNPFNVPPLNTKDEKSRTITLGYTPKAGFAVTLAKLDVEQTDTNNPGGTVGFGATVLGLAWKF